MLMIVLEEERHERKHAEELVAHNNRQIKMLQEKLTDKEEESKKLEHSLEQLKKCGYSCSQRRGNLIHLPSQGKGEATARQTSVSGFKGRHGS